jgi:hydroxyacylglutathione hydrolase
MFQVNAIPAFSDNYIWCIHNSHGKALVIDPGCAASTSAFLESRQLQLSAILITHHHPDHIGGVNTLKQKYSAQVFGFKGSTLDFLDHRLAQDDEFTVSGITFKIMEVPGHTLDHIAFYTESALKEDHAKDEFFLANSSPSSSPSLFCGDTLFSGGCGRLFEGTAAQMHASLASISALPSQTRIYCAHEYTLSNLKFARTLMPENVQLIEYQRYCESRRARGLPTLPVSLATELAINPFLRCSDPELIRHLEKLTPVQYTDAVEIFRAVRKAKDNF